jgi:hypothetical protein
MKTFEYGAVSSKFSCQADNKLTAYCAMCLQYQESSHLIALYTEECKVDSWLSFDGKIAVRLDEIFGGPGAFDKYIGKNIELVKACYQTIKRLV